MAWRYFVFVCHMVIYCIQGNEKDICSNPLNDDGSGACCLNFYRDGDVCKECPPGYFGFNCSHPCPEQSYGHLCSLKCTNCTTCNHVYGCAPATEHIKSDVSKKGSCSTRPVAVISSSMPLINTSDVLVNKSSIMVSIFGDKTENESSSLVSLNDNNTPPRFYLAIIIYTTGSLISFVVVLIIMREIRNICQMSSPTIKNKPHNSGFVENIYFEVADVIDDIISREEIASSMLNINSYAKDGASKKSEGDCKDYIYSTVFSEKEETAKPKLSLQTPRFEASNTLGICTNKKKNVNK
ncbi:uncharacterized protein LOC134257196 [Saccostrea cucullata]|uniref:uncharacterized protein LOC134257196 n=1 Tax=Saccostrea cuccullata TaxID=36930 RepID=UPI002ED1451D